jgi:hypothetical protein
MRRPIRSWIRLRTAIAALAIAGALPFSAAAQPADAPHASVAVILAHGVKSAPLFGAGEITPIDPGTTFVETDLPYAVLKTTSLTPNSVVTLRVAGPQGAAYSVDVKTPTHHGNQPWKKFDFASPIFILGTPLEAQTGAWRFDVLLDGAPAGTAAFQWTRATAAELPKIKTAVDQSPQNADLHWRYGAALALFGQLPDAVTELERAMYLDPSYALYPITLGRVYAQQGRASEAAQQFQKALALHGSTFDSVFAAWAHAGLSALPPH